MCVFIYIEKERKKKEVKVFNMEEEERKGEMENDK